MAEWKITSTTDPNLGNVTQGSMPGEYIFQPPTNITQNIYKIYYIDGDISGETEYIVSSADCYVDKCATNFYPSPVCFDSSDERYTECSRMTVGYKEGSVNTKYELDDCWKLIGTNKTNNVTSVIVNNDGTSNVYYSKNGTIDNIESIITYKFKNETANITGESSVTIIQEPNPCYKENCSSTNVPKLSKDPATKVSSDGGNVTISYTETECWKYEASEIIAGSASIANNVVTVPENESSTSDLTITAKYTFKNVASNVECYPTIDIIQEGVDPCKIDHNCPSLQQTEFNNVDATGKTITVTYSTTMSSCWTLATTKGGDTAQIDTITTGASSTSIVIKPNTDGSSKTMTVTFTFTNSTNGEHCEGVVTITQNAGCVCSDIYFTYAGHDVNFSVNEVNTWTKIGEITVTKNGCIDSVGVTSITEGLSVRAVPNGTNKKDVEVKITKFDQYQETVEGVKHWVTSRKLQFKITLNNQPCGNIYELYQQAFRGTDNGADIYANGEILSDPIFFVGTPGSSGACLQPGVKIACRDYRLGCTEEECDKRDCAYGVYRRNGGRHDADSIRCEGGAYFIDDNNPNNNHKIDSTWGGVYLNENGVVPAERAEQEGAWLFIDASCDPTQTGGKTCTSGMCNVGMIRVQITKNNTGDRCRMIRFKLASEPDPNKPPVKILKGTIDGQTVCHDINGNPMDPPHAGEECAREWYYDIVQIPEGYYLCNYDDRHPENYIKPASEGGGLIPLTEPCDDCNKEAHGNCKCESKPNQ